MLRARLRFHSVTQYLAKIDTAYGNKDTKILAPAPCKYYGNFAQHYVRGYGDASLHIIARGEKVMFLANFNNATATARSCLRKETTASGNRNQQSSVSTIGRIR